MTQTQEESQSRTVGTDSYSLARKMFSVIDLLNYSMWWGIALWAITGIGAVLYLIGLFDNASFLADIFLFVGLLVWIFGPFVLIKARYVNRVLKNWKGNYLAYSHIMSFELSPKEDQDLTHDIVRILTEIRAIKPGPIEKLGKNPPYDVEYFTEIDGKRGSYKFDALIHTEADGTGFIRVFKDQNTKTGIEDVKTLKEQVNDVIKKQDMDILEVVAVSKAGFTEEAVKYASSRENWIGPSLDAVNLIHATPEGYAITWMQYPRIGSEESEEVE